MVKEEKWSKFKRDKRPDEKTGECDEGRSGAGLERRGEETGGCVKGGQRVIDGEEGELPEV